MARTAEMEGIFSCSCKRTTLISFSLLTGIHAAAEVALPVNMANLVVVDVEERAGPATDGMSKYLLLELLYADCFPQD
jgi:hypothetical protein